MKRSNYLVDINLFRILFFGEMHFNLYDKFVYLTSSFCINTTPLDHRHHFIDHKSLYAKKITPESDLKYLESTLYIIARTIDVT